VYSTYEGSGGPLTARCQTRTGERIGAMVCVIGIGWLVLLGRNK
jgi:hypothetical protein